MCRDDKDEERPSVKDFSLHSLLVAPNTKNVQRMDEEKEIYSTFVECNTNNEHMFLIQRNTYILYTHLFFRIFPIYWIQEDA